MEKVNPQQYCAIHNEAANDCKNHCWCLDGIRMAKHGEHAKARDNECSSEEVTRVTRAALARGEGVVRCCKVGADGIRQSSEEVRDDGKEWPPLVIEHTCKKIKNNANHNACRKANDNTRKKKKEREILNESANLETWRESLEEDSE